VIACISKALDALFSLFFSFGSTDVLDEKVKENVRLSYPVLVFYIFKLVFQIGECWSFIRIIFPAFHHYLIPVINKNYWWALSINFDVTCTSKYQSILLKLLLERIFLSPFLATKVMKC